MSSESDRCSVCGHARSEHYEYFRNDRPTPMCRLCDPMYRMGSGNFLVGPEYGEAVERAEHPFDGVEIEQVHA